MSNTDWGNQFEPLDDDELHNHLRLELPPTNARAGWQFDERALLKAIDLLGIELPVRIRFTAGRNIIGRHYAREGYHRITITQDNDLVESNNTLWHELTHAKQAEAFAKRTGQPQTLFYREDYLPNKGAWGASYTDNKYEIEARNQADNAPFAIIQGS